MYTVNSIVPFDLLVDTDMGVLKYIQFHFQNDDRFYPGIMEAIDSKDDEFLESILSKRKFVNPVSAIMKQEKLLTSDPDGLLKSFFDNEKIYKEILKLSTATSIFDMVCRSFYVSDALKYTVLCSSEMESKFIKSKFSDRFKTDKIPCTIIVSDPKNVNLKHIDAIYVKDIHDLDKYFENKRRPEGHNFIIAYYPFNREYVEEEGKYINMPLIDVSSKYSGVNEMSFINVYPYYIDSEENALG